MTWEGVVSGIGGTGSGHDMPEVPQAQAGAVPECPGRGQAGQLWVVCLPSLTGEQVEGHLWSSVLLTFI